jgi:signal transduction histidine kinase
MLESWSLRRRMISAYVLLTCIVCSALAATAWHAIESVEDKLIDQRLARTADRLGERLLAGQNLDLPPSVTLYRGDALPPPLRGLAEGRHELSLDGSSVNALVRHGSGQSFVLVDADADFEAIKQELCAFLLAAFVACLGLAVAFGRSTASQVIAPVTALAHAVEQDQLPDTSPLLKSSDELGVLARAFASRTQDLQQLVLREQWFVADVSHELRTPLTVIIGAAEILQSRVDVHPEVAVLAERIRRTAADTAAQVSALLLLSRKPEAIEAPRIALAPLIRLEMERCQPLLRGKDVSLRFELADEAQVHAPAELVGTAIGNLISNACLYTEEGSVTVRLERNRLVVQDTGVGIPQSMRHQIFERFVRADLGHSGGSGLGLAIVRRVALHLGWCVTLEDASEKGSRFTLAWGPWPENPAAVQPLR